VVSNYDRIYLEITRHTERVEREHGIVANDLAALVMEIVDLEDRNRVKPLAVNKLITDAINQAAKTHARNRKPTSC